MWCGGAVGRCRLLSLAAAVILAARCWEAAADTAVGHVEPEGGAETGAFQAALRATFEMLKGAGWGGFVALLLGFSAWVSVSLPTMPVEVAAGFLYGPLWGCVVGAFGKTVGSCIAFLVARRLGERLGLRLPEALLPYLEGLKARPFATMIGIRLAPLPLGVKNYGLAVCPVELSPYFIAALVVNVPFSVVWASAGASCHSLSEALSFNASQAGGGFVTGRMIPGVFAIVAVSYLAWRLLKWLAGRGAKGKSA